jgi:hypothetical protein
MDKQGETWSAQAADVIAAFVLSVGPHVRGMTEGGLTISFPGRLFPGSLKARRSRRNLASVRTRRRW